MAAPAKKVAAAAAKAASPAPTTATEEAPKEKKKEKKPQKERPRSKKKHKNVQVWKLYKLEGGKAIRKNEPCPRCGAGTFLASFKNRKYCGKCGWAQVGK